MNTGNRRERRVVRCPLSSLLLSYTRETQPASTRRRRRIEEARRGESKASCVVSFEPIAMAIGCIAVQLAIFYNCRKLIIIDDCVFAVNSYFALWNWMCGCCVADCCEVSDYMCDL